MKLLLLLLLMVPAVVSFSQLPPIEPGVSEELAKWRSVQYSNISYKLNLTLEKMSPVLTGHLEVRVTQAASACAEPNCPALAIILDWRKLPGHEKDSTVNNVTLNEIPLFNGDQHPAGVNASPAFTYREVNDHLVLSQGVRMGENVIKLDFTSPILTSGSAITRYIDKEDGSEYIYSLFVPSDASTAFPVFDQPDLKARFTLSMMVPARPTVNESWQVVSNTASKLIGSSVRDYFDPVTHGPLEPTSFQIFAFQETKPISTYVFAFAAGPFKQLGFTFQTYGEAPSADETYFKRPPDPGAFSMNVYVRKSQAEKFKPHSKDLSSLTYKAVKYLETYFDYKFPWPKYDLVLIPEFPFGGMEHAGATFLKESSVIFPTEPTKGDYISRANLIFHETAHQWFGDLVTMRWFDDLWLKEGFAEFMAYKTLEKVMPDANAWKVFYERNKLAAYATDSTRGTTPIYQPIANLSAAKSAYGNIVYRKAPSFLRQAEFYLGEDKFQTAARAFLKKHEYANAGWEDLVGEFEKASGKDLKEWANRWVTKRGVPEITGARHVITQDGANLMYVTQRGLIEDILRPQTFNALVVTADGNRTTKLVQLVGTKNGSDDKNVELSSQLKNDAAPVFFKNVSFLFPNYGDYGYGIFLLDDQSRDYVLKHIGEEKDPFLRSMMWGALWDSVREGELDPRAYVETAINALTSDLVWVNPEAPASTRPKPTERDETIVSSVLGRVSTAMSYYMPAGECVGSSGVSKDQSSGTCALQSRLESVLLDRMQYAETPGQRITFFRAFVSNAATEKGRAVLKQMLAAGGVSSPHVSTGSTQPGSNVEPSLTVGLLTLRTKDKFDIVTRLIILRDPDASKLLTDLEKAETSDDAKRYAYAAHAAFATAENRTKFWNDFAANKDISESWIEAAIAPFNSIRYPGLSQPYLERALKELPNLKRTRKIFFVNNWLSAWLGGQRDEQALAIVNRFLADNPQLDNDLRLKVLENVDVIERAVRIRKRFNHG